MLLGIAGIAAAMYFSTKKAVGLLNYYISKVELSFSGATPILRLTIGIQNPSNETFQINSFVGNLLANGYVIGNVSSFEKLTIGPASLGLYKLTVRLSLIGVVSDIVNAIQQGSGTTQTITFKGAVNASGLLAPVNLQYKIL